MSIVPYSFMSEESKFLKHRGCKLFIKNNQLYFYDGDKTILVISSGSSFDPYETLYKLPYINNAMIDTKDITIFDEFKDILSDVLSLQAYNDNLDKYISIENDKIKFNKNIVINGCEIVRVLTERDAVELIDKEYALKHCKGPKGDNGLDAFQLYCLENHGYIPDKSSPVYDVMKSQYLQYFKGDKGDDGLDGRPGQNGSDARNWLWNIIDSGITAGVLMGMQAQISGLSASLSTLQVYVASLGAAETIEDIGDTLEDFSEVMDGINTTTTLNKIINWFKNCWSYIKNIGSGYGRVPTIVVSRSGYVALRSMHYNVPITPDVNTGDDNPTYQQTFERDSERYFDLVSYCLVNTKQLVWNEDEETTEIIGKVKLNGHHIIDYALKSDITQTDEINELKQTISQQENKIEQLEQQRDELTNCVQVLIKKCEEQEQFYNPKLIEMWNWYNDIGKYIEDFNFCEMQALRDKINEVYAWYVENGTLSAAEFEEVKTTINRMQEIIDEHDNKLNTINGNMDEFNELIAVLNNKLDELIAKHNTDVEVIKENMYVKFDYYTLKYLRGLPENMFYYNDTIEEDDIGKNSSDMFNIYDKNGILSNNNHIINYVKFKWIKDNENILTITTTFNKESNTWFCDYSNTSYSECFFSIPSIPESMLGLTVAPSTIEIYVCTKDIVQINDDTLEYLSSTVIDNISTNISNLTEQIQDVSQELAFTKSEINESHIVEQNHYYLKYAGKLGDKYIDYDTPVDSSIVNKEMGYYFYVYDRNGNQITDYDSIPNKFAFKWNNKNWQIDVWYIPDKKKWKCNMVNNLFDHPGYVKAIRDDLLGMTTKPHNIIWSDDIRNQYVLDALYLSNVGKELNNNNHRISAVETSFDNLEESLTEKIITQNTMIANQAITSDILLCDEISESDMLKYQFDGSVPDKSFSVKASINDIRNITDKMEYREEYGYADGDGMFIRTNNFEVGKTDDEYLIIGNSFSFDIRAEYFNVEGLVSAANVDYNNKEYIDELREWSNEVKTKLSSMETSINDLTRLVASLQK